MMRAHTKALSPLCGRFCSLVCGTQQQVDKTGLAEGEMRLSIFERT